MVTKFKVGDYVEVLEGSGNTGVKDGEQGIITLIDHFNHVIFPNNKVWSEDEEYHWVAEDERLKLVYRPRFRRQ